jgi:uncharacterized protein
LRESPSANGQDPMEPQERDLITTLLTRLQSAATAGQPKDAEADQLIRQAMAQMPDAPYYLVQTVLIQDLSLHNAQNRIAELEKQVASLPPPQQQQPTSFLGGLFGRSQSQPPAPSPLQSSGPSVPQGGGPWSRVQQPAAPPPQYAQPGYAQPGYAQPGYAQPAAGGVFGAGAGAGGGFLRSAAATAAGVAGGALLFEGISSLFGHNYASGLGGFGGMGGGMPGGLGETVINNYNGDGQGGSEGDFAGGGDGGYAGGGDYAGGGSDGGYAGGGSDGGGGYDGGGDGGGYDGGGDSGGGSDDFGGGDSGGGGDSFNC